MDAASMGPTYSTIRQDFWIGIYRCAFAAEVNSNLAATTAKAKADDALKAFDDKFAVAIN